MLGDVLDGAPPPDADDWERLARRVRRRRRRLVPLPDRRAARRRLRGRCRSARAAGCMPPAGARLERELGARRRRAGRVALAALRPCGRHAARVALRAARRASGRASSGAHADAAQLLRRAIESARGAAVAPTRARGRAAGARRGALARSGRPEPAQHAVPARAAARRATTRCATARCCCAQTRAGRPRGRRAPRPSAPGCRALRTLDDVRGAAAAGCRARLLAALAAVRQRAGALRRRDRALRAGDRRGRGGRTRSARVAHACHLLDWALHDAGRGDEATHSARALAIYERLGDLDRQAAVLNNLGGVRLPRAATGARRSCSTAAPATRASRPATSVNAAFGDCNIGEVLVEQGRLDGAPTRRCGARCGSGAGRATTRASRTRPRCSAAPRCTRGAREVGRGQHPAGARQAAPARPRAGGADGRGAARGGARVRRPCRARAAGCRGARARALLDARLEPLLRRVRGCALAQLGEHDGARSPRCTRVAASARVSWASPTTPPPPSTRSPRWTAPTRGAGAAPRVEGASASGSASSGSRRRRCS